MNTYIAISIILLLSFHTDIYYDPLNIDMDT